MHTPRWQRAVARLVLVTFSVSFVACGGGGQQAASTTTTIAAAVPATVATPTVPPPTAPPAPPPPTLPAEPPDRLGQQDLRELVAPVALYPDVVLASLLPATTYADQVHEAAQYIGSSTRVERVPDDRGWDGSVVALMQFPDVVRWVDDNPAWTDEMAQAVTYQQGDVLQAIQDYRRDAVKVGNLKSNEYQNVRAEPERDIRIEPAQPDVVYVPSYDPVAAMQPQPAVVSPGISPWIVFGAGAAVTALGAFAVYSIFDDDDDHHHHHGGGRHIRRYNNYYYSRGRRPARADWTPRERARRARAASRPHPHRLEHKQTRGAPLRAPSQQPGETRREQRQERREQKQEMRHDRREQKREHRQDRRHQKQENRQERREQKQERQQEQREQRQDRREQKQERRDQRQDQQREQRQERREQKQENREQRQMQRQERRQSNQAPGEP
jgi:hypothetical protein